MTRPLLDLLMRPQARIGLLAATTWASFALGVSSPAAQPQAPEPTQTTPSQPIQDGQQEDATPVDGDDEKDQPDDKTPKWVALFNGEDLKGWTPKFSGHKLGENYKNTFRVEDGLLRVVYDGYSDFDGKFGHLFFSEPFASYDLRVVYRFHAGQVPGGPGWAFRNNGVMFHGQSPESMGLDQDFPVSIEAQLLGQKTGAGERSNGNLCTPGTNVEMGGEIKLDHCMNSDGPTSYGEGWITFRLEVRGNKVIRHFVDGHQVMEYQRPQLDPRDGDAKKLLAAGAKAQLSAGTISLQAESHPIDFKSIEIRLVEEETGAK